MKRFTDRLTLTSQQQPQVSHNGPPSDINALLNNPAILQALSSQMMHGNFPSGPPAQPAQPAQPSMPDLANTYSQNLTPSQTTRSGRISRPPVAAPTQDQLAMLQQILGSTSGNNGLHVDQPSQDARSGLQRQSVSQPTRQSDQHTMNRPPTARTSGVKRPHSALRDASNPPQSRDEPGRLREMSPPIRPVPDYHGGRPRKEDPTSKEERLERRRIQNSQSGMCFPRGVNGSS